jgi:5'-nucleotidase
VTEVLVTNDDGIDAPGLHALVALLAERGHDVLVVAPARQFSGASASILIDDESGEVTAEPRFVPGAREAWAIGAAPAMCVLLAQYGRFGRMPGVVVSGINEGANTGRVLLHSGTVGAALTAGVGGGRAIAVSLDVGLMAAHQHWDAAAAVAESLLQTLLAEPAGTVLNVNVPNGPGPHPLVEAPLDAVGIVHTTTPDADEDDESVRLALAEGRGAQPGSDQALLTAGSATVTAIVPPAAVALQGTLPGR